jgi:hypothetical protein
LTASISNQNHLLTCCNTSRYILHLFHLRLIVSSSSASSSAVLQPKPRPFVSRSRFYSELGGCKHWPETDPIEEGRSWKTKILGDSSHISLRDVAAASPTWGRLRRWDWPALSSPTANKQHNLLLSPTVLKLLSNCYHHQQLISSTHLRIITVTKSTQVHSNLGTNRYNQRVSK